MVRVIGRGVGQVENAHFLQRPFPLGVQAGNVINRQSRHMLPAVVIKEADIGEAGAVTAVAHIRSI